MGASSSKKPCAFSTEWPAQQKLPVSSVMPSTGLSTSCTRLCSWSPLLISREWFSMPYQDEAIERFVWGATAGMLRNFYRFLSA